MIAEMKKVSLVSLESHRTETLSGLRTIGVVHLHEIHGQSEMLDELQKKKAQLEHAILLLPEDEDGTPPGEKTRGLEDKRKLSDQKVEEVLEIAKRIEKQSDELHGLRESIDRLQKEIERLTPLGDIEPSDLEMLRQNGVNLKLFNVPKDKREEFPTEGISFVVHSDRRGAIILAEVPREASEEGEPSDRFAEFPEFELPSQSLSSMEQRISKYSEEIEHIEGELKSLCKYRGLLQTSVEKVNADIEFENVRAGLQSEGTLIFLSGFVPSKKIDELRKGAADNGWGLLIQDPSSEDPIPTMVENPKPVGIIKPVFDFLGTVPGYYEYDISFFFLLFFTLFLAMIIGDAGYGTILLGTSLYSAIKTKKRRGRITNVHSLLFVMGGATVLWGAITGVWFGSLALSRLPVFSWMIVDSIYGFGGAETQETIKHLCFVIGTLHLSIAHIWNFLSYWKKGKRLQAISQLGWLSMVLGLYYLVLYLVLDPEKFPVPQFSLIMVAIGLVLVLFLSEQEGNFFKGMLKGLANFMPKALDSISAFSDIISYIRLFAVGLATVEIAKSFNSMAADMGSTVLGIIGGIVILFIGHGLNMAMAALSVVVHGVRLNVLEFSGHLGMEWTGIPYNPFRDRLTKN
ncbi:MAG: V-type ATP synthase subunit I [Spirochaetales bacterium]|nr:V-type ATP synthase subunit I [Spirochaetales bacterium]